MLTVLIIDDDTEMRKMLRQAFVQRGWRAITFRSGQALAEAWCTLKGRPDLVVTDTHMPGINGLGLLAWLRERSPDVPVLLITAFGDARFKRRARELGARALVSKPFDIRQFSALAKRVALGEAIPTGEFAAVG